ncbi:enoyl-CoA hydratase/isomerase family protein [Chloroflexota bacterium]
MGFETIIFNKEDRIANIVLNRPEVLNALNKQMEYELTQVISEVSQDEQIRVVVIKGAGHTFCAEADFRFEMVREQKVEVEKAVALPDVHQDLGKGNILTAVRRNAVIALHNLEKPTIAMVNGAAVGFGFDLALACDMRIGSPEARFIVAFTKMGLASDSGGSWLMPRVMGLGKALEYIFTGDTIDAEEAHRIGILNRLVPAKLLEKETMDLARKIANGPPIAHRLAKMQVYKGLEVDLETALAFAAACISIALSSEDHKEGIKAFAEKRPPDFKGI